MASASPPTSSISLSAMRLVAGEDAAIGERQHLRRGSMPRRSATISTNHEKLSSTSDLQRGAHFRRHRMVDVGLGLERARRDLVGADADGVEQLAGIEGLEQHADRADDRQPPREDAVGGDRRHVGGRGAEFLDDGDHRLFGAQLADRLVELLAAGGGAAGRVDGEDHGLDAVGRCRASSSTLAAGSDRWRWCRR